MKKGKLVFGNSEDWRKNIMMKYYRTKKCSGKRRIVI